MSYYIGKEEVKAVTNVLLKGDFDRYIHGAESASSQFEKNFADAVGVKYALAVSSGTAALICGLTGMRIGPGDEVIIPAFTYIATALAVLSVGAIPIIAEIDSSLTIDVADIQKKITPHTKAIIPVHMQGLPCNMSAILRLAKKNNLLVLEDVAQACGGAYGEKKLGSIGDAGAFSFNHFKILTCGEGGALVTNKESLYYDAVIQQHGGYVYEPGNETFENEIFAGGNFRISEISSAMLQIQLTRLEDILRSLRKEKSILLDFFSNHSNQFNFCHLHDPQGDCGTHVHLIFNSNEDAQNFIAKAQQLKIEVWLAKTKRHVYSDWQPLLNQKGANCDGRNAFLFSKRPLSYEKDMCPQSLNILNRTVVIPTKFQRPEGELKDLLKMFNSTLQ